MTVAEDEMDANGLDYLSGFSSDKVTQDSEEEPSQGRSSYDTESNRSWIERQYG